MSLLLLDTQVLLWWLQGSQMLGRKAVAAISNTAAEVFVSAASIWEIAIKWALGRLSLDPPPYRSIPSALTDNNFRELAISVEHALAAGTLDRHHADPFDRMLIAQARIEKMSIITADAMFDKYDVKVSDATD